MSYRTELAEFIDSPFLPSGLKEHLRIAPMADLKVEYQLPFIRDIRGEPIKKRQNTLDPKKIRLPARINSPLHPYPSIIRDAVTELSKLNNDIVHGHHQYQITKLNEFQKQIMNKLDQTGNTIKFDINSLISIVKCNYSSRTEMINTSALEFAKRATSHELSISAMETIPYHPSPKIRSPYLSFLISMQRMRVLLALKGDTNYLIDIVKPEESNDANATLYKDGKYSYIKVSPTETYILLVVGSHFRLYHSAVNYWFAGNITYLDYALTLADTINNLELLSYDKTYEWACNFFEILIDLAEKNTDHNITVDYMKSLEGFILNLSDYDETYAMNWIPIMDAAYDLWKYDMKIIKSEYPFIYIPSMLHDPTCNYPKKSYLCKMIATIMKMTRVQRQEVSSLHKFVFYAEVDGKAGVNKFLKRVHTKRYQDNEAVKNITRLAKAEFVLSYIKKHKNVPTFKEENQKTALIRLNYSKSSMKTISQYPLKWWDEVTPWNCMDNTLTDDALEFAKDKGALKSEITLGPGDSKKELLQVMQKENYKLKELMPHGPFLRQTREVKLERQSLKPVIHDHPARLIEKEREQKIEARLFANGELSNKHALSVYTTKMKKVLSYYTEQLMTPSDSKRKQSLHYAAQSLRNKRNYSMLLDIEGHNQSMQEENTYEMLEFIGNIFGESNWGSLSNYFGSLLVYHYDEYLDEVTTSKGQYGGIEGWMNPAWTLHTLLMMKLLRYMTDIDLQHLMVYSDDVDSIVKLDQVTEYGIQSLFSKVMNHCNKFGMIAKFSQTTLSKHRTTMLRQHYAEGLKSDSTLKRLMSVSGVNNPILISEELEVAGICSSIASSLEGSNHSTTCCYLKNYKLGILLSRLPHMLLGFPQDKGSLSERNLPTNLSELLYHIKDDRSIINEENLNYTTTGIKNDLGRYLKQQVNQIDRSVKYLSMSDLFSVTLAREKFLDNPDRMLYLQIYDDFVKDLLFFLIYLPTSIGGLGGIFHINMMLSGHSNGYSKSLHYLKQWCCNYSSNTSYFLDFMRNALTNTVTGRKLDSQHEILNSQWPSEKMITSATISVNSAIRSMVAVKSRNVNVKRLLEHAAKLEDVAKAIVKIFSSNYHPRIAQFYYENSSVHFIDLLVNKIETSSGLLLQVRNLAKLRKSLAERTLKNIRTASVPRVNDYGAIFPQTDIIQYLMFRREKDFPTISFIKAEEILYDDKLSPVFDRNPICSVRKCAPTHYENGLTVYNNPKLGNEILYKGEYLDHNRMIGNKEELLAAKVCSITKWLLTKTLSVNHYKASMDNYDCVLACNITLKTLTGHTFKDLMLYCPDETGGEILHRIPNMRFSTVTYIRSELNRSLNFTSELNQYYITENKLVDSNVNFDYLRLRLILSMMIKDEFSSTTSVIARYNFSHFSGICDVQFVMPKVLSVPITIEFTSYSSFRNHKFSDLRFRFIAASYLTVEDITDLSLLPNSDIINDITKFGDSIIGEIIYKYARSLDNEYMTFIQFYPREDIWEPLYPKLEPLIKDFKLLNMQQKHLHIMSILKQELESRLNITLLGTSDKAASLLQSDIYTRMMEDHPNDQMYTSLTNRYLMSNNFKIGDKDLKLKVNEYNSYLKSRKRYMNLLGQLLISEIIITLFFKTKTNMGTLIMDVKGSMDQYDDVGPMMTILQEINPELYIKSLILGVPYLQEYYSKYKHLIQNYLYDISTDIVSYDMELPTLHVSTSEVTNLESRWTFPESTYAIEYHHEIVYDGAMRSINDIHPMIKYIERICDYASNPQVYTSPTGSDSAQAQVALFRMMMLEFGLSSDTNICDLTAGRGDGKYALNELGLQSTSYVRPDVFTNVLHHPDLIFNNDYDVFNTETILFLKDYDFVHIDISFTQKENPDISDCIMFLESNSIPYTLRMNSINLMNYTEYMDDIPVSYNHYIAHSISSQWRTYQVYLIGIPGSDSKKDMETSMKKSNSFRSMALSYTSMIPNSFRNQYNNTIELNSITACFPNQNSISELLIYISDRVMVDERNYYLDRFLTEYFCNTTIYLAKSNCPPNLISLLESHRGKYHEIKGKVYSDYTVDDIGKVKSGIEYHHIRHVHSFHDNQIIKLHLNVSLEDRELINSIRRYHPLRDVRRLCNILLGIYRMCPDIRSYELEEITQARNISGPLIEARQTRLQKDLTEALKLHIVSLSSGDELLPLRYCSIMANEYPAKRNHYDRIRKYVKLISGYRSLLHMYISNGTISSSSISTMGDELFIRRCMTFLQVKKYNPRKIYDIKEPYIERELEFDLDGLFKSFEQFALSSELAVTLPNAGDTTVDDPFSKIETSYKEFFEQEDIQLHFNIDVEQAINQAVDRLQLELDPKTGIYKGFDISVPDDEDLW